MTIDIQKATAAGGATLIDLCEYCVCSAQLDPLFVILVRDYQILPANGKALALFDVFCQRESQNCLTTINAEKPVSGLLVADIERLRQPMRVKVDSDSDDKQGVAVPEFMEIQRQPANYLFNDLARGVVENSVHYHTLESDYDPELTAHQNLPGGIMSPSQRNFADQIWPSVRGILVTGGFVRMASIG